MNRAKLLGVVIGLSVFILPVSAFAANPELIIRTQTASGSDAPDSARVTVEGEDVSLSESPSSRGSLAYTADFDGGQRTVSLRSGDYLVYAEQGSGYAFSYSSGCEDTIENNATAYCTITARERNGGSNTNRDAELIVYVRADNSGRYCESNRYDYGCSNGTVSDFRIRINGNDASPSEFRGSSNGTRVRLDAGSYSVEPYSIPSGWTYRFSGDCSGAIRRDQERACTVTFMSRDYGSNGYLYPLPQPYRQPYQQLSCAPAYQQVPLNAAVTFTATGGNGTYSWGTPNQGVFNGPTFIWTAAQPGLQNIVVSSAGQTAVCALQVIGAAAAAAPYYPRLPNTGYAPVSALQLALAAALLLLVGRLSYPYVRNAFTYLRR